MAAARSSALILAAALSVAPAGAYYHFIHSTSRFAPFNGVPEKFDLNALPGKTVTVLVSDSTPSQVAATDLPSLLSAIREAVKVWSGVETSDLRVAFGGYASAATQQNAPGIDV